MYLCVDIIRDVIREFIHCIARYYCRILQGSTDTAANSNDGGPEFAEVFVIVWIGSMVVTLNSKLLGGNM